jgi:hypothetical protein
MSLCLTSVHVRFDHFHSDLTHPCRFTSDDEDEIKRWTPYKFTPQDWIHLFVSYIGRYSDESIVSVAKEMLSPEDAEHIADAVEYAANPHPFGWERKLRDEWNELHLCTCNDMECPRCVESEKVEMEWKEKENKTRREKTHFRKVQRFEKTRFLLADVV